MCLRRVAKLIRNSKRFFESLILRLTGHHTPISSGEEVKPAAEEAKKEEKPLFRFINTHTGLPNAPKWQLCEECDAPADRVGKGPRSAFYRCRNHKCRTELVISIR